MISDVTDDNRRTNLMHWLLLPASILFCLATLILMLNGIRSYLLLPTYLISIICLLLFGLVDSKMRITEPFRLTLKSIIPFILVISLPLIVRVIFFHPDLIHQDEFIFGYHSAKLNLFKDNIFGGFPPDIGEWQTQTPLPYWLYQHLFLAVLGASPISIKLTNVPVIFLIGLLLFLFTNLIQGRLTASIALIIYAFLAPAMYFDSLTINNHVSTIVILAWLSMAVLDLRHNSKLSNILSGLFCAIGMMFYPSSYLILPGLIIVFLFKLRKFGATAVFKKSGATLLALLVVLSPFAVERAIEYNSMFITRVTLVSREGVARETFSYIKSLELTVRSLFQDDVGGGHHGFTFGRKRLLALPNLILMLAGMLLWKSRHSTDRCCYLLMLLFMCISFFIGATLFSSVPAYQRLISIFPFVAIFCAVGLKKLFRIFLRCNLFHNVALSLALLLIILTNLWHYRSVLLSDFASVSRNRQDLHVSKYITHTFAPDLPLLVASFSSWQLKKVIYFFDTQRAVLQKHWKEHLDEFDSENHYLYLILRRWEEGWRFEEYILQHDPKARVIEGPWTEYAIITNLELDPPEPPGPPTYRHPLFW